MAYTKKDKRQPAMWEKAKWQGFVNVRLGKEEKKAIKGSLLQEVDALQFLVDAATDGYKCSISYSIPEDVFTVSMTGQYEGKPNAGVTMSMRHVDFITAVSALYWCHVEAGKKGDWGDRYSSGGQDDW